MTQNWLSRLAAGDVFPLVCEGIGMIDLSIMKWNQTGAGMDRLASKALAPSFLLLWEWRSRKQRCPPASVIIASEAFLRNSSAEYAL